jgi:hypothetical protein
MSAVFQKPPNDVLVQTLSYIDIPQALKFTAVCRHWKECINTVDFFTSRISDLTHFSASAFFRMVQLQRRADVRAVPRQISLPPRIIDPMMRELAAVETELRGMGLHMTNRLQAAVKVELPSVTDENMLTLARALVAVSDANRALEGVNAPTPFSPQPYPFVEVRVQSPEPNPIRQEPAPTQKQTNPFYAAAFFGAAAFAIKWITSSNLAAVTFLAGGLGALLLQKRCIFKGN